jgi:exosortase A-associated hydrolase 1
MSNPAWQEHPAVYECNGDRLIGIATKPQSPLETGVVIIVGGPQYRAGSHRQFTLLARHLAGEGVASFRFDYRGMGDSEGTMRTFEQINDDIRTSIDTFIHHVPDVKQVVLWGLCDAASASLYYGHSDPRVKGMVLLNPWVHTEASGARARIKHYYLARLLSRSFWTKLLSGKVKIGASINDLTSAAKSINPDSNTPPATPLDPRHGSDGYIDRMLQGIQKFKGKLQFILSGHDLTAEEFISLTEVNKNWKSALTRHNAAMSTVREANHTFSTNLWRNHVAKITTQHIKPAHKQ